MKKGISSFDNLMETQRQYESLGNTILEEQRDELSTQLQVFQGALLAYSKDHSKEIVENPRFRAQFSQICSVFGVDPLVDAGEEKNEDYIHLLSIRLIELCHRTKDINGGLLSVQDAMKNLQDSVSEQDIVDSVQNLEIIGDEIKLVTIGHVRYLKSTPIELNQDQDKVMEICLILNCTTIADLMANFQWSKPRCQSVINEMIGNGLLWVDSVNRVDSYYRPPQL